MQPSCLFCLMESMRGLGYYGTQTANARNGWQAMLQIYPSLAKGYQAQILRLNERLSAYDGWLDIDSSSHSDDSEEGQIRRTISVSQLEKYASCGLQYYFYYALKLRSKEIAEFDRTRWLQASDRGTLLHDVFRRYLEEVTDQGTKPAIHNRGRLVEIVEKVIGETRRSIPAPNMHVFAKECEEIRRDVEIFFIAMNSAKRINHASLSWS